MTTESVPSHPSDEVSSGSNPATLEIKKDEQKEGATGHNFQKSIKIGKVHEDFIIPKLFQGIPYRAAVYSEQRRDIDYILEGGPASRPIRVEVKVENQEKGNLSVELLSEDRPTLTRGWLCFTESDYILYYLPKSGDVVLVPTQPLQRYALAQQLESTTILAPNTNKPSEATVTEEAELKAASSSEDIPQEEKKKETKQSTPLTFEDVAYISVNFIFSIKDVLLNIPGAVYFEATDFGHKFQMRTQAIPAWSTKGIRTWKKRCTFAEFQAALLKGGEGGIPWEPSFKSKCDYLSWGISKDVKKRFHTALIRTVPVCETDAVVPQNPSVIRKTPPEGEYA